MSSKTVNQFKALIISGLATLLIQWINNLIHGNPNAFLGDALGMLIIILICFAGMKIKDSIKIKIPSFAWASIIALLLTAPFCPIQEFVLKYCNPISTSEVSTLILAVAGVSIGNKLSDIKRLSWRMVIVAIVVFCGTFFGSALIAQLIMKAQGII